MKRITSIFPVLTLLWCSGCMTRMTLDAAKEPRTHKDETGEVVVDKKSTPGYYAVVPFAVIGDIATAPIQLIGYSVMIAFHID